MPADTDLALREALVSARSEPNPAVRWIERPGWLQSFNTQGKTVYQNTVYISELPAESADAAIAEAVADYERAGLSFRWILGPWTRPADMPARLLARGLTFGRNSFGLACPAARVPEPPADPAATVERVDARNVEAWAQVYCRAWEIPDAGRPAVIAAARAGLSEPSRPRYLALIDGVPAGVVACAYLERSAYGYGGAVLPQFRKRGLLRRFLKAMADDARAAGRELLTAYAFEDTSFPILKRMGFEVVCECPQYFWSPR